MFPQTELPVFVDIAPGASPAGTLDSWTPFWTDITRDVRVGQKIVIDEGIPDEANQADPGSCVLTLDNGISRVPATAGRLGCYTTRNPSGPYYGKLQKNTPLRVRIQRGRETFNRVANPWGTSDSGIAWSNTGALWSMDGTKGITTPTINTQTGTLAGNTGAWDFEMTGGVGIDITASGSDFTQWIQFRRGVGALGNNNYYIYLDYTPSGNLNLFLIRTISGSSTTLQSNSSFGVATGGTRYDYRLKVEGGFIFFRIWPHSGTEPTTWQINYTETAYNLDNSSLGTNIALFATRFTGAVTTQCYWYDITVNQYPFVGTVPEWPVRWDQSGNDSTGPIKATGVLRSLQSGKTPVKSPLYSFMDAMGPSALWTLEDGSGATLVASQTPNVQGGTIFDSDPGGWDGPPKLGGTVSQYTVNSDTTLAFTFPRVNIVDRWLSWFVFYMPVLPVVDALIYRVRSAGTIVNWDMRVSQSFGGIMFLTGQDATGAVLVNFSITYVPGQWTVGQIEIQQTGSTFTGRLVNYQLATGAVNGATSSPVTGSIGSPNSASVYGSTGFQAGAAGPVAVYPTIPAVNISNLMLAGNGFAGEDAGTRSTRLAAERGIRLDLISGGDSSQMGVQPSDQFLNVMGQNAITDIGLLTEFRGGLRYRTRGRRYNQNARMALDYTLGHIKLPPEPTDDDQRTHNDITVTNTTGSSARAYDAASIAAITQLDTEVDVNCYSDNDLPGQAGFRLYLGTWNEMRWPSITLDLARNAGLANYLERATALDAGAYVTLANPPTNLPIGTVDLLVEHVQTTIAQFEWTIELTCQPYGPWRITDSSNTTRIPRMDLVGSTLGSTETATAIGATDTWTITNAGRSWDATQLPLDWMVNGERVTCTALTGTSSQTATVTRGVNGITKIHSIGEAIQLADPMFIAL